MNNQSDIYYLKKFIYSNSASVLNNVKEGVVKVVSRYKTMSVTFSADINLIDKMEQTRGKKSRSKFIREAVEAKIKGSAT